MTIYARATTVATYLFALGVLILILMAGFSFLKKNILKPALLENIYARAG